MAEQQGKTVIYLRRSTVSADSTGDVSHEQQLERCRSIAREHGDANPVILEDWGLSGAAGKEAKRTSYQELKRLVGTGTIRWIVAYDLSRLSRSVSETEHLVNYAKQYNCSIHVGDLGKLDGSAAGEAIIGVMSVFNRLHVSRSREARLAQVAKARERGEHLGRYGYGHEPGEDVQAVLDAFAEAGSYGKAAKLLNARGVQTPRYNRRDGSGVQPIWRAVSVRRIVVRAQGQQVSARKGVRSKADHLLAGLVTCHCGRRMTVMAPQAGRRKGERLYCAAARVTDGHGPAMVYQSALLPFVRSEIARLRVPSQVTVGAQSDERTALEARRARVVDSYIDGLVSKADRDAKLAAIDAELLGLAAAQTVVDVPTVDIDADAPGDANRVLRSVWTAIQLDAKLQPVAVDWTLPAEYIAA